MDEARIARFRARLMAILDAVDTDTALGEDRTRTVALDQQTVGRLSRMDALQKQAMAKAQQARRAMAERRIRAALSRIDEGGFGYCTDCGEPIAEKRLDLDPTISTCINSAR
ncbi:TraR/DksA family transcriptional regulator [Rhodovulum euryhalinum]|uniref:TraR/DksA family transcriptional regulator n=1 Tax=Rhodovulum euryhalinum TaxID=35805 RepID=A0A4R2KF04_9RHOB|nr:TraR/DksA C4-type zinc finger protein [Rhodovulum euryhalinum]TCO70902.1 TraR/DksA family transcriptional regulator [Rhodovulum euryhalinum]